MSVIIARVSLRWKSPNSEDMTLVSLMAPIALSNSLLTCSSLNHILSTYCHTFWFTAFLSYGFPLHYFLTWLWAHWNTVRMLQLQPLKSLSLVIHKMLDDLILILSYLHKKVFNCGHSNFTFFSKLCFSFSLTMSTANICVAAAFQPSVCPLLSSQVCFCQTDNRTVLK